LNNAEEKRGDAADHGIAVALPNGSRDTTWRRS